jgi:hypothetical protein
MKNIFHKKLKAVYIQEMLDTKQFKVFLPVSCLNPQRLNFVKRIFNRASYEFEAFRALWGYLAHTLRTSENTVLRILLSVRKYQKN